MGGLTKTIRIATPTIIRFNVNGSCGTLLNGITTIVITDQTTIPYTMPARYLCRERIFIFGYAKKYNVV